MSGREMLSARVPPELKSLVDADSRTNQEVVRAALWREFGGERMADIERRVKEKEKRMSLLESEITEREQEKETEKQELEALRSKLDKDKDKEQRKLNKAKEAFETVPDKELTKDNQAVQDWADKLSMDVDNLVEALREDD